MRLGHTLGTKRNRMAYLIAYHLAQAIEQIVPVLVIQPSPRFGIEAVMKAASAGCQPDLSSGGLPAQDELRAVGKFDGHRPVSRRVIRLVGVDLFEVPGYACQALV